MKSNAASLNVFKLGNHVFIGEFSFRDSRKQFLRVKIENYKKKQIII